MKNTQQMQDLYHISTLCDTRDQFLSYSQKKAYIKHLYIFKIRILNKKVRLANISTKKTKKNRISNL